MDQYLAIIPKLAEPLPRGVRALMVCPAAASATERATLANIVVACGLSEGDDCHVLALDGPTALPPLPIAEAPQWVIAFGIQPRSLGVVAEVTPYRWSPALGGRRYCFAERLALIGEDMARKKRLWATIKSLKA